MLTIPELLAEYQRFDQRLLDSPLGEETSFEELLPTTATEIDDFSRRYQTPVPPEVRAFWLGLKGLLRANNLPGQSAFFVGFDFVTPAQYLERDLPNFRRIAALEEPGSLPYRLSRYGLPLSYHEPQLTWLPEDGKIYWRLYDGETPEHPVADSFTEFFTHYLAAGCFCSHDFWAYWPQVAAIAPFGIPPAENKWVQFYERTYPVG